MKLVKVTGYFLIDEDVLTDEYECNDDEYIGAVLLDEFYEALNNRGLYADYKCPEEDINNGGCILWDGWDTPEIKTIVDGRKNPTLNEQGEVEFDAFGFNSVIDWLTLDVYNTYEENKFGDYNSIKKRPLKEVFESQEKDPIGAIEEINEKYEDFYWQYVNDCLGV